MKRERMYFRIITLGLLFLAFSCKKTPLPTTATDTRRWVNTTHLEQLYLDVTMANGTAVGVINIYSNYPDYALVGDDDEGFTCVDDVARTVLFYVNEPDLTTNAAKQATLRKLTEFVLQMQSPNGYFYNFLFENMAINTAGVTSKNQANWWSWRALWCLTEAYNYYKTADAPLAARIQAANQKLVDVTKQEFGAKALEMNFVKGLTVPKWLPNGSGSDQAAIMVLGLLGHYQQTQDAAALALMEKLAGGIVQMQQGDKDNLPYGAFLSWENIWHAYGNDQAYALLKAGKVLNKQPWIDAGLKEVDNFYPYLLKQGFLESFEVEKTGSDISQTKKSAFAQIAYGIRPMISATLEAYSIHKDPKYAQLATQLASWFVGSNPAKTKMYNPASGLCFDGISSANGVNKNSGAESTIEALWAFQQLEKYPETLIELEKHR